MQSYSEQMLTYLHKEELVEAQYMLIKALKHDSEEMLLELGEELLSLGFLTEAKQIFEDLFIRFPDWEELNLSLAEIAIENDLIDDAFTYLENISVESEHYVHSLLICADLYQLLGIPEVSEVKLKEAQQLSPEEPLILFALGELYFSSGQLKGAVSIYMELLAKEIQQIAGTSINERIGNCLSSLGNFEEAVSFLEKALAEEQTDDRLFQLGYTYLQIDENQKAISLLQQLRLLNPTYQTLYLPLAQALQTEELLEEAEAVLTEGIKENPYQVELFHLAAENSYRLHASQRAEQLLKQALAIGKKSDETRLTLSNLYLEQERYEEIVELLQSMEETSHPYSLWNLAHAYSQLEQYEFARNYYEEAYLELSHEPEFLKEYALFLREEGAFEQMETVLMQYLKYESLDDDIQMLLEEIQER